MNRLAYFLGLGPANVKPPHLIVRLIAWYLLLNVVLLVGFFMVGAIDRRLLRVVTNTAVLVLPIVGVIWLLFLSPPYARGPSASFTSSLDDQSHERIWHVVPARASRTYLMLWLFLAGLIAVIPLLLKLLFGPIVLFGAFANRRAFDSILRHRQPTRLTVGSGRLTAGQASWPGDQIASLSVGQAIGDISTIVTNTRTGDQRQIEDSSDWLWNRQSARSWRVSLRVHGDSQETILAGGLTRPCAVALAEDLQMALAAPPADVPSSPLAA